MARFWNAYGKDVLVGGVASFCGYFVVAALLGNYPKTARGWLLALTASVVIGAAFASRFFLRSLLPVREPDTA
jgi:uncharacterized membrane protein (UPF0136 family)